MKTRTLNLMLLLVTLSMAVLFAPPAARAATYAIEIQIDVSASTGADSRVNIFYGVVDSTALRSEARVVPEVVLPTASPGTWKDLMIAAVIADAATAGYTLTADNVRWISLEPGDYKYVTRPVSWTKDVTKTNLGAAYVNAYVGSGGEGQLVNFAAYKQYRLVVQVNKIGTGTQTAGLVDINNAANLVEVADAAAAGEHTLDSGWTNLPAWTNNGDFIVRPMVKTTLAGDDPVYRQFALYLR
jgi:hypothetical protein